MAFLIIACCVLGLTIGSFLNVVIYRVPRDESIVQPRSHCPSCNTELKNRDNIPILSWALLRGRCRTCANPISVRYPAVELLTGVLFGAMAARLGFDAALPAFLVLAGALVALSAIDLDTYLLPKKIVWPTLVAGAVLLGAAAVIDHDRRGAAEGALGALIFWGVLFALHLISPKGMGFGDVRLAAVLGLYLGWIELPLVAVGFLFSFALASVVGIGLMVTGKRTRKDRVPFGPFLAAGCIVAILFGEPILRAYLKRG